MWALCRARPKTFQLDHLLSFHPAGEGGGSLSAIWPERKSPEYMNKGSALLQAGLKLVYYGALFEISVGGSGRAERGGSSLHPRPPRPFVVWAEQVSGKTLRAPGITRQQIQS